MRSPSNAATGEQPPLAKAREKPTPSNKAPAQPKYKFKNETTILWNFSAKSRHGQCQAYLGKLNSVL